MQKMSSKLQSTWLSLFALAICAWSVQIAAESGVNPSAARLCYSCEGINCQRTTKQNATMQCLDALDYCVIIFDELSVVAKGCYAEMPKELRRSCDKSNVDGSVSSCQKCFGQLCNNKGRADVKCIMCSESQTSKCMSNAAALTPEICDAPTGMNTYCYVRESQKDGVTRGCALHQADQLECQSDAGCSLCLPSVGAACNTYALSAESAAAVSMPQHALLFFATTVILLLKIAL